ncbi:MAG: hypothetical protein ACHQK9_17270 [Reyranellales bacterium]
MQVVCRLLFILSLAILGAAADARAQGQPQGQTRSVDNPAEAAAYKSALNMRDAAKRAQALEVFLAWYPNSVLRIDAFEQLMAAWQVANNLDKADAAAQRLLQLDPDNVRALANRAFIGRTRAMTGDATALGPAVAAAQRGMAALAKWPPPAGISDAEFVRQKIQITAIFDGTLGFAALQAKDYARAWRHFLAAVTVDPDNLQDVYQLSVAQLESTPLDPLGFWYAARAIALARGAKNESAAANIDKYVRSRYQRYHGSEDGWNEVLAKVAAGVVPGGTGGERLPPDNFAASIPRALSPAETAVQLATANNPATLSFADSERVLSHRDDSGENREAADKVWQAIGDKQRDGVRLKIAVKVISATPDRIEAAITDENQASNTVDLSVALARPLSPLPAAGAAISIIGAIGDYRVRPFMFLMTNAELAAESLPVAGGTCAEPRPALCTLDYRPACGVRRDGSRKTYGNACSACTDPDVISQGAGACP